jgi:hypothetical protein
MGLLFEWIQDRQNQSPAEALAEMKAGFGPGAFLFFAGFFVGIVLITLLLIPLGFILFAQ